MSQHISAHGYAVGNPVVDVQIEEDVFAYPTGALSISPVSGDVSTTFKMSTTTTVDPAALAAKSRFFVDGTEVTPAVDGTVKLPAGAHQVSASLYDSNGARFVTPAQQVLVSAPPPPPATKTTYGISHGSNSAALQLGLGLGPHNLRVYDQLAANWGSIAQLQGVPNAIGSSLSHKPDAAALARRDSTVVGKLVAIGDSTPDDQTRYWTIRHEENNNPSSGSPLSAYQALATQYQKAWDVFLGIIDQVNRSRTHELIPVSVVTGSVFDLPGGPDLWYVDGTIFGADCYSLRAIQRSSFYALNKKIPWALPEWGYNVVGAPVGSDANFVSRIVGDWKFFSTCANPPVYVDWFNANNNDLTNKPLARAALKKLFATGSPV